MKQPRALAPLFLTEMWERFGFYVIQSMLVIYMSEQLSFSDTKSYAILGGFTALVYISPLLGGFIADKILGFRYSILIGAMLLSAGYLSLAIYGEQLLLLSLSTVVVGNGLLKPNISSFLGAFYYDDDPRRSAGFTLFYMGINLGSLLATTSSGFIHQRWGWTPTFGIAGIAMLTSILVFCLGFRHYENRGLPLSITHIKSKLLLFFRKKLSFFLLIISAILLSYFLLKNPGTSTVLLSLTGISTLAGLLYAAARFERQERNNLVALVILFLVSILFWSLFFQLFFSINLFVERNVYRGFFGITLPASLFISLEAFFILLLGPFLAKIWLRLGTKGNDPSPGIKFTLALFFTAVAMTLLVTAIYFQRADHLISPLWIIPTYLFITIGELLLSPIGLALTTELSPPGLTGLMMGIWFMTLGFGGSLAGYLAQFATIPKGITDIAATNTIYSHAFCLYTLCALATSVILLLLTPWLNRLTHTAVET